MNKFLIGTGLAIVLVTTAFAAAPLNLLPQPQEVREITIRGVINDETAQMVVEQIKDFNTRGNAEITLKIVASPGGAVYSGLYIYDTMQESSSPIKTVCEGYCMSMAAILLTAGDQRETSENTTIMFHQLSMGAGGKLDEVMNMVGEGQRLQKVIDGIIGKHSGLSEAQVHDLEAVDHFMSPQEAKKLGLIDKVKEYADK